MQIFIPLVCNKLLNICNLYYIAIYIQSNVKKTKEKIQVYKTKYFRTEWKKIRKKHGNYTRKKNLFSRYLNFSFNLFSSALKHKQRLTNCPSVRHREKWFLDRGPVEYNVSKSDRIYENIIVFEYFFINTKFVSKIYKIFIEYLLYKME